MANKAHFKTLLAIAVFLVVMGPVSVPAASVIVVDDFESYDASNRIYYVWYDERSQPQDECTGAWLGLAIAPFSPVHSGLQAMQYLYDTDSSLFWWRTQDYAEAWLPFDELGGPQDWTAADVNLLTLFFYGQAGNDASDTEQMYVAVKDSGGLYAEMRYGDNQGEDMNDLKVEDWQQWTIPLAYFSDGNFAARPNDVNLSAIETFYIGFGDKWNPVPAGNGTVYFDNILLSAGPVCRMYVDANAPGPAHNGWSWKTAHLYLNDALGVDLKGAEIWVAQGTYKPDANLAEPNGTGDREATFQLINGAKIYGGYAGYGALDPNARDVQLYETILSGDLDGNDTPRLDPCDLPNDPNRGENSYHVVTGSGTDANAVLDGFTITGGNADANALPNDSGGGMYNNQGSPTVTNCTFSDNLASYGGGGMYNYDNSNPTLNNCTFFNNSVVEDGGGMYNNYNSFPVLTNCKFIGNWTEARGGGMRNQNSYPTVTNCIFIGNSATTTGGGMYNVYSDPVLTNCTFTGNVANFAGAAISNNVSAAGLTNCIVWGNMAPQEAQIHLFNESTLSISYTNIQGGRLGIIGVDVTWGPGNIDTDHLFVDPDGPDDDPNTNEDNDYRLAFGSPCIDAGDNNSVPADSNDLDGDGNTAEPLPWDLDGRNRFADGDCNDSNVVDMGAYEFAWVYIGDFDGQCDVDFADWALFAMAWLKEQGQAGYIADYDISIPADNKIDWRDVEVLCDNWLAHIEP